MVRQHTFRHPDLVQQLPFRDYIRQKCPTASQGLSVLDLDLVILQFGALIGRQRNEDGKFALVELKHNGVEINYAQNRLLNLMHRLLRAADPERKHYIGAYLLHWDADRNQPLALNEQPIPEPEFLQWIVGRREWPSMYDD